MSNSIISIAIAVISWVVVVIRISKQECPYAWLARRRADRAAVKNHRSELNREWKIVVRDIKAAVNRGCCSCRLGRGRVEMNTVTVERLRKLGYIVDPIMNRISWAAES